MQIQGEQVLAVPRADVWRALNDPAVLRRCLAGCDTFEPDGDDRYRVAMQASVGPVRARFTGRLQLRDVVPPSSYALSFEGSGGVAGFGKGMAQVALDEVGPGTRLRYAAQAQVGGRLAQVGERLIDGVTRRMADDFFGRFAREVAALGAGAAVVEPPAAAAVEAERAPAPIQAAPASVAAARSPVPVEAASGRAAVETSVEPAPAAGIAAAQTPPTAAPPAAPTVAPPPTVGPASSPSSTQIAVIAAAVSATAAAVAVLAAVVAMLATR
jgi:carbon monoxide dehydrogenase subunit G